ncbi:MULTISPECIES: hypothetical protein [unclassified Chryseobacterium]|uniref:hypothetical protein n=1 Tax=unclassified Chryseobacterium TaxID=2593645 RepID=UPI00100AEBB1|nr:MULTISPECIES: hypothetical protein [unclassified Chryseobacterium]RXM49962.1 hypothetical protein BOQ64_20795 [Chryseobacterium sp. CH25]RXM62878.1 hypothetical protein BOQ60_18550 [Chryseobacterium sp. CH1]
MKALITSLNIILVLSSIHCQNQSKNGNIEKNSTVNTQQTKIEKIELTEQTRGFHTIITLTPKSKFSSFNGEEKQTPMSSSDWERISKQAAAIDLSKISTLEAPTTGRNSDQAMISNLIITSNGTTYTSASFDSGNPPKELKSLYDEFQRKQQ